MKIIINENPDTANIKALDRIMSKLRVGWYFMDFEGDVYEPILKEEYYQSLVGDCINFTTWNTGEKIVFLKKVGA